MANRMFNTFMTRKRKVKKLEFYSSTPKKSSQSSLNKVIKAVAVKILGFRNGDTRATDFEIPDIDFDSITAGYDTDGYIRQGVDKYIDLMWKEGFDVFSKNPEASLYIKRRLAYMAEVTGTPQEQFLYDISEELIKYHNVVIAKARQSDPSQLPEGYTITGLRDKEPVVGYFVLNVKTFSALRDSNGMIKKWKQTSEDGEQEKVFPPEDIIHIYYRREKGDLWAKPFLLPVLDDVRSLRELEENVLRMAYLNIFPFHHIKCGTDEMPASDDDIDVLKQALDSMDREGSLVTAHTVDIKPIATDKVIDASPYLKHFEERVFSGIGIPGIMFGRGNTANRNTGDNMTNEVTDRVKAYQKVFEMFFYEKIIKDLLFEGGFDPIMNPDDKVELKFKENDVDRAHKVQNQAVFLYEHNAITEDEMRDMIGKDPIELDEERNKMFLNIITLEKARVEAQLKNTTSSTSSEKTKETNNKTQPTNQYGKKETAKKQTNAANEILSELNSLQDSLVEIVKSKFNDNHPITVDELINDIKNNFKYRQTNLLFYLKEQDSLNNRNFKRIYRVFDDVYEQIIKSLVVYNNMNDTLDVVNATFEIYKESLYDLCNTFLMAA
jgi:hypothetical protein